MKCKNCKFFEERSKFCRLNPPQPVVTYEDENSMSYKIKSMFPTIHYPDIDWCSYFKEKNYNC
jgi:hypothetical protein